MNIFEFFVCRQISLLNLNSSITRVKIVEVYLFKFKINTNNTQENAHSHIVAQMEIVLFLIPFIRKFLVFKYFASSSLGSI